MTKKEFSSGGVVVKKAGNGFKVLLIKDAYGHWTWPKGNIEKNETPEEAAVREIREEVGLKGITLIDKIGATKYFYKLHGALIYKTVHIFLFEADKNEKITVQRSEIDNARWFDPAKALEKIEYKGSETLLKKAITGFEENRIK